MAVLLLFLQSFLPIEDPMMEKLTPLYQFEQMFDSMKPAQVKDEKAFAWFSGIPHPFLNAIMHSSKGQSIEDLLKDAPDSGFAFWVHDLNRSDKLIEELKEHGFQSILICPIMTWMVKPFMLPSQEIRSADSKIFYEILAKTFQFDPTIQRMYQDLMDSTSIENFLVYLDGKPVGTGSLLANEEEGGIFNVAVLPEYQRKGCGTAMSQFLMHRAYMLGLKKVILQSSPTACKMYRDLDFQTTLEVEVFAK